MFFLDTERRIRAGLAAFLVLLAISAAYVNPGGGGFTKNQFDQWGRMTGIWVSKRTSSNIYERWERKSPTEFAGLSFKVENADTTMLETIRLYYTNGDIIYVPKAAGQNDEKEVSFPLKTIEGNVFVFENKRHDFPSRIVYNFKSPNTVHAYIDGLIEGKKNRIDYPFSRLK